MERDGIIILDPGLDEKVMLACVCCKLSLMPDRPAPEPEDKAEYLPCGERAGVRAMSH